MTHLPRLSLLIALAAALTGCGDSTELVVVGSEREANRILVELEQRGIPDLKSTREVRDRKPAFSIKVPKSSESAARQILVKLDLPREERGGLQEMVGSAGLIPTRADERARLMYALSGELEKTLETYDRVVRARVHVVIPDTDMSLSADPEKGAKPSATVVIKYRVAEVPEPGPEATEEEKARLKAMAEAEAKPPVSATEVAQLASRSIEGLEDKNVFVSFTTTNVQQTKAQAAAAAVTPASTTARTGPLGIKLSDGLFLQLFGAVVVLALLCIFLITRLIKKGKKPVKA
jgi:type III secretion system YscJ/HrcJ family lipoprotein